MKKVVFLAILANSLMGAGFMNMGMSEDVHVMLSSPKVLSEGENRIKVELNRDSKDGEAIAAKDVRIKFFMPAMPGMPYMESKDICKKIDNFFECKANFSMGGTWQMQLFFKDENGDDYKYKSSVNLGESSSAHMHH